MTNEKTFGQLFGDLVKRHREDLGWSQAELAYRAWGEDDRDFVGQDRAAQIRRIEIGEAAKPQAKTIKAMQTALNIAQHEIDALKGAGRTPDAALVAKLLDANANLARELKLNHDLVVEIARRYALSAEDNFHAAVAGIAEALRVAEDMQRQTLLSGNLDAQVRAVLDRKRCISPINPDFRPVG